MVAISKTRAEPTSTRSVEAVLGESSKRRSVSVLGSSLPDQRHRGTHVAQPTKRPTRPETLRSIDRPTTCTQSRISIRNALGRAASPAHYSASR